MKTPFTSCNGSAMPCMERVIRERDTQLKFKYVDPWGDVMDGEWLSSEEAFDHASDQFAQRCIDDAVYEDSAKIDIISYVTLWHGEDKEISRDTFTVHYRHYHGDYAEHNTHWGLR